MPKKKKEIVDPKIVFDEKQFEKGLATLKGSSIEKNIGEYQPKAELVTVKSLPCSGDPTINIAKQKERDRVVLEIIDQEIGKLETLKASIKSRIKREERIQYLWKKYKGLKK